MIIKNLSLQNFRNFKNLSIDFFNNINVLYGENGVGKTNIVEAISFLLTGNSFQTRKFNNAITFNQKECFINGTFTNFKYDTNISINLSNIGKKISINSKPLYKISELRNIIDLTIFSPKDGYILKKEPSVRRNFINFFISKSNNDYLKNLIEYKNILEARNNELKKEVVNKELLEAYSDQLSEYSYKIFSYRNNFFIELNQIINDIFANLYGYKVSISIYYQTFLKNQENYIKEAKKIFKENLEKDIEYKRTTKGVHLDDFVILKNGKNAALYSSQGENRLIAISLILSTYFLKNKKNNEPIIILDDVLNELDEEKSIRLIKLISNLNQAFITSTKKIKVDGCKITNYLIKDNKVIKMEE